MIAGEGCLSSLAEAHVLALERKTRPGKAGSSWAQPVLKVDSTRQQVVFGFLVPLMWIEDHDRSEQRKNQKS